MKKIIFSVLLNSLVILVFQFISKGAALAQGTYDCNLNDMGLACELGANTCVSPAVPGSCAGIPASACATGIPCVTPVAPTVTATPTPLPGQYACIPGLSPGTCVVVHNCQVNYAPQGCTYSTIVNACIEVATGGTTSPLPPACLPQATVTPTLSANKYKCVVDPSSTVSCIRNSSCSGGFTAGPCTRSGSSCSPSSETSCQAITPPPLTGSPIPTATPGRPADRGIGLGCIVNGGVSAGNSCDIAAAFGNNCIPGTTPVPLPDKNGVCTARTSCVCECEGAPGTVPTALGCVPYKIVGSGNTIVHWILNIIAGIVTGISLLLGIIGGLRYVMSAGNPEGIEEAKGVITAAVSGLLLTLFSVLILRVIGIEILGLPQFIPSGGDLKIE